MDERALSLGLAELEQLHVELNGEHLTSYTAAPQGTIDNEKLIGAWTRG